MEEVHILEIKQEIFADNSREADVFRSARRAEGTFMVDIMGSPGAGKTTLLLALIDKLRRGDCVDVGVIEADLASDVDALKIKEAGVTSVELNTKNVCHVEMGMVETAFAAFNGMKFDYMFLENIGNLVCPAEFDTGCHCRIMLLSVPEGYDKVYKYPPMFAVVEALVVTKCDYLPLNTDFDRVALREAARMLNPNLEIFEVSARTGEGMDELVAWFRARREAALTLEQTIKTN
ncbi:MAG: hydrogenase accessory protein HypB [Bacteroidia bacterium]|nr:hydrogenase accessory protein HypB [Bacteroidia bacterium]NCC68871.1 hydrogenase accessory protein HypB [Clostridia bacterium]